MRAYVCVWASVSIFTYILQSTLKSNGAISDNSRNLNQIIHNICHLVDVFYPKAPYNSMSAYILTTVIKAMYNTILLRWSHPLGLADVGSHEAIAWTSNILCVCRHVCLSRWSPCQIVGNYCIGKSCRDLGLRRGALQAVDRVTLHGARQPGTTIVCDGKITLESGLNLYSLIPALGN